MPSYNQRNLAYAAQNANAVKVMLGDVVVAYAQTTTHSADAGTQQLYGIGSALPQEIQQLRISPSIALEFFELTQAGINLLGTGQRLIYTLFNTQLNVSLVDASGNPTYTYVGAVMSSYSETVSTNSILLDSVSFLAMDVLNNLGQSILASNSAYSIPSLIAAAAGSAGLGNPAP